MMAMTTSSSINVNAHLRAMPRAGPGRFASPSPAAGHETRDMTAPPGSFGNGVGRPPRLPGDRAVGNIFHHTRDEHVAIAGGRRPAASAGDAAVPAPSGTP